ncbi:ABC transporter substrate-binding protein [Terrimonas alba]|uniref:ABC transporter substrate-binding protein n=1 Tax=Terrimonas alba TaxID=3349636 RepID=UPI0035F321A2
MKIGILYPRSKAHPGMMQDFMEGIKTALKQHQLTDGIQLFSESIGFGGNEKEVYEKAEKLLILEETDVLVAYVDLRVLEILKPLLYTSGRLVIIVNPGANYPLNWVPQPNIINLTLQHGFLCWLSGKRTEQLNKRNALMATAFYDCGYLHTTAMVKSFVKSGGNITFNYVNNQRYDDSFEIKQLTDYLSSDTTTNILLCVFDSLPASLFYSLLNNFADAGSLHLLVSPMMLESKALERIGKGFEFAIEGYIPWHPLLENKGNQVFIESYLQQTKRSPTVFSLLGWETALILQQVFQHCQNNFIDGASIAGELKKMKINSPRGEMRLDDETNYFVAPAIKCSVNPHSDKIEIQSVEHSQPEWETFVKEPIEGATSGWTNTYLCY